MALDYNVQGPIALELAPEGSTMWERLGFTENESLFSVDPTTFNNQAQSTDQGEEPGEIIHTGRLIVVTGVLSKWDADESGPIRFLTTAPGATLSGSYGQGAGQIGCRIISPTSLAFTARLLPLTGGKGAYSYTFPRCFADENAWRVFDHGNVAKLLGIRFTAIRSGVVDELADGSAGDADVFTRALVL